MVLKLCCNPILDQTKTIPQSLNENSFSKQGGSWIKTNIREVLSINELETKLRLQREKLPDIFNVYSEVINELLIAEEESQLERLIEVERLLWPLKIDHPDIPSFMVPIQADWAADLFDSGLGRQTLWGSDPDLVFKMDNVYYRSAKQKLPTAPSRILWYVSRGKKKQNYQGDMAIRACSYVDEVVISKPKDLFKQFSKLGVFDWQNVYKIAEKNIDKEILAFRFSRTELFENPISLKMVEKALNRKGAPRGPMRLGVEQFNKLYRIGTSEVDFYDK